KSKCHVHEHARADFANDCPDSVPRIRRQQSDWPRSAGFATNIPSALPGERHVRGGHFYDAGNMPVNVSGYGAACYHRTGVIGHAISERPFQYRWLSKFVELFDDGLCGYSRTAIQLRWDQVVDELQIDNADVRPRATNDYSDDPACERW